MNVLNYGTNANLPSATHTAVTVANSSTVVVNSNDDRVYLLLINDSDETIYINCGADAVVSEGIRINAAGGSYEFSPANANLYQGVINAICTSGNKKLLVTEG